MRFAETERGVAVERDGKMIYEFCIGDEICRLGVGENTYSMSHGSFKIKEKIESSKTYVIKTASIENGALIIAMECGIFEISIDGDRLCFTPNISDEFNRMWIMLFAEKNESVYGCGEIFTEFNLRGKNVNVWVAEHINALQTAKKILKMAFGVRNTTKKQKFRN